VKEDFYVLCQPEGGALEPIDKSNQADHDTDQFFHINLAYETLSCRLAMGAVGTAWEVDVSYRDVCYPCHSRVAMSHSLYACPYIFLLSFINTTVEPRLDRQSCYLPARLRGRDQERRGGQGKGSIQLKRLLTKPSLSLFEDHATCLYVRFQFPLPDMCTFWFAISVLLLWRCAGRHFPPSLQVSQILSLCR